MKTYYITQQTSGTLYYTVMANSEEEAIEMINNGSVEYDEHDWGEQDVPFVESVDEGEDGE